MDFEGKQPAWLMTEPWPVTLVAYRDGNDAPDLEKTLAELAVSLDLTINVLELHGAPDESQQFSVAIEVPGFDSPVVLSCQRATNIGDAPSELQTEIQRSKWVIIGETLLSSEDPLATYASLGKLLASDERTLILLDGTTGLWLDRKSIQRDLLDENVLPSEELLWQTRVVSESAELDSGTSWIFTSGLLRCGLPELEMLEVPSTQVHDAARMLDIVASLILESGAPGPEVPLQLGEGINVTLIPWQDAIKVMNAESLGSLEDREHLGDQTPNPLVSTRAAVCDLDLHGTYAQIRTWPKHALEAMIAPDSAVYTSNRSAIRQAALARRSWPDVVDAVSRAGEKELIVFVGLPIGIDSQGISEHGWIQVEDLRPEGGAGLLLRDATTGLPSGTRLEFTIEQLGGWRICRGEQILGPMDNIDPLTFLEGS